MVEKKFNEIEVNKLFEGVDIVTFNTLFADDEQCYKRLAELKWENGFICRSCGHTNYCAGKQPYSRRCTRCKKTESATAHSIFHSCKIGLAKAFQIAYLVCENPSIAATEISYVFNTRHMTCLKFKKRILACKEMQNLDKDAIVI